MNFGSQLQFQATTPSKRIQSGESFPSRRIRIALVEDQIEIRENRIKLINFFPDFICSCVCATEKETLLAIPQNHPDVVADGHFSAANVRD